MNISGSESELLEKYRFEDGHQNPRGYAWFLNEVFQKIDPSGKRILEVGSGKGLLSLHCALAGANQVLSLEPELDGSMNGAMQVQRERCDELGLKNLELSGNDFNLDFDSEQFDIVLLNAVINHLYETPHNANNNRNAFERFVRIANKLYELTAPKGVVIFMDACRYCLWTQLRRFGFPKNWCLEQKTIQWRIHQQPTVWRKIFIEAGFQGFETYYPVPFRLRLIAPLLRNSSTNFLLTGMFICHAKK